MVYLVGSHIVQVVQNVTAMRRGAFQQRTCAAFGGALQRLGSYWELVHGPVSMLKINLHTTAAAQTRGHRQQA